MNTVLNKDWKKILKEYPLEPYTLHPDSGKQFKVNDSYYIPFSEEIWYVRPVHFDNFRVTQETILKMHK